METIQAGLRGVIRFLLFILVILSFLAWSFVCHAFVRNPKRRLQVFSGNGNFFAKLIVKTFGIDLTVINKPTHDRVFLLVSNHMGFIDIVLLFSQFPLLFVTSKEMKETPFLGLLTEMGGCIYVERRSRSRIKEELGTIADTLKAGFRVVLYPEATSTNGEQVLPFKKTLLMSAGQAGVPIQPVVVNFREVNGEPFTTKWRDHLCWYGDIPFITSLWKSLTLKSVKAELKFLDEVHTTAESDRGEVATKVHAMIASEFVPVKPDGTAGLTEALVTPVD